MSVVRVYYSSIVVVVIEMAYNNIVRQVVVVDTTDRSTRVVVHGRFLFGAREKTAKNHSCSGPCSRLSWNKNRRITNAQHCIKLF